MVDDGGNKVGKKELQAELYKTKGVNAKTLHLVQLLMASTLQGCTLENYEDASFYLLFFLELVGTFYEEHSNYFVFFFTVVVLLTTVFLCYLNSVRWRLSLHIGRGPNPGLEPGYRKPGHRATRSPTRRRTARASTPNRTPRIARASTPSRTEDNQSVHTEPDREQPESGVKGSQRGQGEGTQLDPEMINRMNAWMEDNVLPLLGAAPAIEARPLGATSSQDPHPLPGQLQTTRGMLQPGSVNLNRRVRFAPNWGYGYHVATCSLFRRAARYFQDTTVKEALEQGLFPCEQCCRGDHKTLLSLNRDYFEQKPRRKRR